MYRQKVMSRKYIFFKISFLLNIFLNINDKTSKIRIWIHLSEA